MKIRPKIPIFLDGGGFNLQDWIDKNLDYYKWYQGIYPNAPILQGNPLQQRNDNWNKNELSSSHYTTDDLRRSAYNNYLYTNDYNARQEDLNKWAQVQNNIDSLTDEQVRDLYNSQAQKIRDAREAPQTYNTTGYSDTNRIFRNMFYNRSRQGTSNPLYTIGYQENLDDIEGTSTWQRRMDRYQNRFEDDSEEGKKNRIFYITRPNGTKVKVYKKENGDIELFPSEDQNPNPQNNPNPQENPQNPQNPQDPNAPQTPGGRVPVNHKEPYKLDLSQLKKYLPNLLGTGRLIGNLWNNERVYGEALKGIKPDLRQTYLTHRQVLGDEGTRQGFYTRAAQGQTKASRPFTSDADRQIAYQMEAKRIGDELRAQGDLADNQEIRRTSDESNQHQWANTQRATEVANANIASMNAANALRHNLLAQKHSANWTSIDNALLERETRLNQKQEYQKALQNQIWALDSQHRLENNVELQTSYQAMYDAYNKAYKKYNGDASKVTNDPTFKAAKQKYDDVKYRLQRLQYEEMLQRAKNGIKISYKKKDDLLYKTTRDAIEHFQRMSKISSDAQNRRKPKIEKLTSHPKKYQQGGVAPFTVYRPAPLGGESGISQQTGAVDLLGLNKASKASSGDKKNETLDMVKELFKAIQGKGLPSDVNVIYNSMKDLFARAKAFGTELTSDDIAGLYLQQMEELNKVQYMKENFDKARDIAISKDAMGEFAVNADGTYIVQKDGKIGSATLAQIKEGGYNPLTNEQVLNLRAVTPGLAMDTSLFGAVQNGVGMTKIAEHIKSILPKLETDELVREGYTHHEANQIVQGLEALQQAPAGDYKVTTQTKSQKEAAQKALYYIAGMLPKNMRAVLEINALERGTSFSQLLQSLVGSNTGTYSSIQFDAVTGKAAKGSGDGDSSGEKIKSNPLMQMIQGEGGVPRTWNLITRDSNVKMSVDGIEYSQLPKITEDMSLDKMLSESGIAGILDSKQGITFGDQQISHDQLKDIMYSNSGGMVATLPCKIVNGHKEVNLGIKQTYEEAVQEVESRGISRNSQEYYKVLGEVLKEKGLDSLLDRNGYPDRNKFGEFLIVEAYTTTKLKNLDTSSQYVEKVKNPDAQLEERMIKALSTDSKKSNYKLDIDYWLYGDDVYRGTVFIPLTNNLNAANNAWGSQINMEDARELENKFQNFNKASNMKPSNSDILNYETK